MHRLPALFLLCASAFPQPGIPPETAGQATGYMEWMLDARFTPDQRRHYHEILAGLWAGSKDAILSMARAHETLASYDEAKRSQLRAARQPEFLRLLAAATDDSSRWLFALYRAAHPDASPAAASGSLTGRWTDGHISSIQYRDSVTGVSAPTNGRSFAYEFKPDGTYSFTGLMQNVLYNCTTALFSHETGTYSVNGDSISLRPEKNPYRMTNTCAPSSNRESPGKLIARNYRYRVLREGGRAYLELRGDDGAPQKFGASQ